MTQTPEQAADIASRLRTIADSIDDIADSVNTSLLDRYIDDLRTIAEETAPAAPKQQATDVYVLSVDYRDGTTNIVRVSRDLDDLLNHYGPDSFSPAQPWKPVQSPSDRDAPVSLWETRFASGNDGAHLWIRRMPLHAAPTLDPATDTLLDNYDPTLSLVARGVMADPTGPDADPDSSAFEAAQDRIVGEVWKWLNRHDAPWSPSDAKVSDLAYAIANSDPAFTNDPEQPTDAEPTDVGPIETAADQHGCAQCQGVNSEQCPRCDFEAEYAADATALSTLITDGLAAGHTPEKMARTILASDWLAEATDRVVNPMVEGATARLRNQILALIPTGDPELIEAGYTILASDVLDRLHAADGAPARARRDPGLATMSDVEAFREGFYADVPTISDGDLIGLMNDHTHLLSLAREWGWNETQVRDDFAAALEARAYLTDN